MRFRFGSVPVPKNSYGSVPVPPSTVRFGSGSLKNRTAATLRPNCQENGKPSHASQTLNISPTVLSVHYIGIQHDQKWLGYGQAF